jgi:hypothetical protein
MDCRPFSLLRTNIPCCLFPLEVHGPEWVKANLRKCVNSLYGSLSLLGADSHPSDKEIALIYGPTQFIPSFQN